MITHVSLRNWKAYRRLDLSFEDGATFVIAKNGIGKTSLVEGAKWALFGDLSNTDPAAGVRSGSMETTAVVDLRLTDKTVRISRTYSAKSRETEVTIAVGGQTTAGVPAVERFLTRELGADLSILSRMCFLREGEAVAAEESRSLDLRSHLASVFGVDTLVALSAQEDHRRRFVSRDAQETRSTQRLADSARTQLTDRAQELETDLSRVRSEHEAARSALSEAQQVLAILTSWSEFDLETKRRRAAIKESLHRLSERLAIGDLSEANVLSRLASERAASQSRLEELSRKQGAADAERALLVNFSSSLQTGPQTCPACLRSITGEERRHAVANHADRIADLRRQSAVLEEQVQVTRVYLAEIDRWTNEFNRISALPVQPRNPRPDRTDEAALADARDKFSKAMDSLENVAATLAHLNEERLSLEEHLTSDAQAAAVSQELFRRYREQALSELVSTTLERSANELVARRIDPLATEIRNRWKVLWPSRAPLRLLADGTLVATRAGQDIQFGEFSGGEKVMSTIILRLLALSMTTTTPFLWLDEPLEHLDPRNRRMVASLLVKASQGDRTKQIVATTYEEAVARRLDETDTARLIYVESEPTD